MRRIASTPSTRITDEQIGKLFDQIRPGIRNAAMTREVFQRMLEKERELKICSRVTTLLEQIALESVGSVTISVDYDEADAIAKAIDAGSFDRKYIDLGLDSIPIVGSGKAVHEVLEFCFGRTTYSRSLPAELDTHKLIFADPLTALWYAVRVPDRQRKYPLCILFTNKNGWGCELVLCEFGGGPRLDVCVSERRGRFPEDCRFLVVRKPT